MTKNLPSVINQPATILYLPYEILSQILTYSWQHIHYRSSFPSFARVQRSWTAPTLELLYRDVALSSSHKTLRVARSLPNGQNLHLTKKMKICYFTWIHEVGDILRSCVNLRHLELFILDNIPSDLFEYPSLRNLQTLVLRGTFDSSTSPPLLSASTKLQSLKVYVQENTVPVLRTIVNSAKNIQSLNVIDGFQHLHLLTPVATHLTSFTFYIDLDMNFPITHITDFLTHAISLSHLNFHVKTESQLSEVTRALNCRLETLILSWNQTPDDIKTPIGVLEALNQAAETEVLVGLRWIKLSPGRFDLSFLTCLKGWSRFNDILAKNGTEIMGPKQ